MVLSAVCAPVAQHSTAWHGTVLLGAEASADSCASCAHLPTRQAAAGDTLTAHPSLLVTSAGRGKAQSPHHRSWHLGFFAKLNSLFFMPLSRWSPGSHTPTSVHNGLQQAGTDPELLRGAGAVMGLSVGAALPTLICNISIV